MKNRRLFLKSLAAGTALSAISISQMASADTLRRSSYNPHFTVNGQGATVTFTWYAPVPASVEIRKHSGGYNSSATSLVYEGAPPASLSLIGGGRTGGGRYWIRAKNAAGNWVSFNVDVIGPANVKNW